jgi:hypothetical protein
MKSAKRGVLGMVCTLMCLAIASAQNPAGSTQAPMPKFLGSIMAIHGSTITLAPDGGQELQVTLQNTKMVRIAPGEKDLENAAAVTLQELQVGDRVLVRGQASADGKSVTATALIVMKKQDVETKQQHEREDWQKRGIGGLVSAVDPAKGDVSITNTVMGTKKTTVIHTAKSTVVRRYAPDSVRFDDAKPSTVADIHPGDQVRGHGTRSADGSEFNAEELVSGSFRNIAATVDSIDVASNSITVYDLVAKKAVVVKIGSDSQLRKLPPEFAQRIAMRLKGGAGGNSGAAAGGAGTAGRTTNEHPQGGPPAGGAMAGAGSGQWRAGGAAPDFQQMLNRMPAASLGDFRKGDAVMIVSTEGSASGAVTAITLLSGVEPILAANGGQPMTLSPWSLTGGAGGEEGGQ